MTGKEPSTFISDLDTKRFGFPIARINQWTGLDPLSVCDDLKKSGVRLIMSRVNAVEELQVEKLKETGFEIMDTIIHYRRDLPKSTVKEAFKKGGISMRIAGPADIPPLRSIAGSCLRGGHYFADKRLEKLKSIEVYEDWITRSVTDPTVADRVYIAEKDGVIIGFATFSLETDKGSPGLWAGIGAVHSGYRNLGVCRSMLQFGINEYIEEKKYHFFGSAVSENNPSVNKVFLDIGCLPDDKYYSLHCWL
ncbi:MAG: GNAT family N-acetyltransferase [Roseivirga sp.]|nr:GNAT family N-acetyltransferase [Roseivirga sp.]